MFLPGLTHNVLLGLPTGGSGPFNSGVVDLTGKTDLIFTGLDHTTLQLAFDDMMANSRVQISNDNGATWISDYSMGSLNEVSSSTEDKVYICSLGFNLTSYGTVRFRGFNDPDVNTTAHSLSKGQKMRWFMGRDKTIRAHNAIRIRPPSGTFTSGKIVLTGWTDERIAFADFAATPATELVIPTAGIKGPFTDMDYIIGPVGSASTAGRFRVSTTGAAPWNSGGSDYSYARYSPGSQAAGPQARIFFRDKESAHASGRFFGMQDGQARTSSDAQHFTVSERVYAGTRLSPQVDTAIQLKNDDSSNMATGVAAFYGGYEYEKIGNYQNQTAITENNLGAYSDLIILSDNQGHVKVEVSADGGATYETGYVQATMGTNWNNNYTESRLFHSDDYVDRLFTIANFNQAGIPTIGQGTGWKGGSVASFLGKVTNDNAHNAIKITAGGAMPNVTIYGKKS